MFSKQEIEKYFVAEKQLGVSFMVIGTIAVVLAIVYFFVLKINFYKGAAIPLLVIGLVQLIAAMSVYKSSDKRRIENVYAFDMNPALIKNAELPRMQAVVKSFAIIKWIEMGLIVAGLALIFYYRNNAEKTFFYGLGLALTIQALIMLLADNAAERRAIVYRDGLEQFAGK